MIDVRTPNTAAVTLKATGRSGWEQWFLLSSDRHHDSKYCDRAMELRHLEEAKARSAFIIDIGDLFDAMQGPGDRRARKGEGGAAAQEPAYFDALVSEAVDFYGPYADRFLLLGHGNHETAVLNHYNVDLTNRLRVELERISDLPIFHGSYTGWLKFYLKRGQQSDSVNYWYHHGWGGGGPVTKGAIQFNRIAARVGNAHIMHMGHVHESMINRISRSFLDRNAVEKQIDQLFVRTAGYKNEHAPGESNWHTTKGFPCKPLGAAWLRVYYGRGEFQYDVTEAK